MERGIPIGTIAGIRVAMSWVVPLVALLYAFTLAESLLPARVPYQTPTTYWLVGALGAAAFFLSLLAHEMGHALVGRWEGIGVRGITLTLFGGYTQFDSEPETPGAELRVSAIGPVTNLVLAGLFWATALVTDVEGSATVELTNEMLLWLAFVNLLLAVINMLPGAPLDGGAVLEAVVWQVTRDRNRAATITATIGVALGVGLAVLGFLRLGDGGTLGLWMLVGGLIIAGSARSRLRSAPAIGRLRDTALRSVMVPDPPIVPEEITLAEVVANAAHWRPHTAFPVQATDGRITGLLTADLVVAVPRERWATVRAAEVAWPIDRVVVATVDDPLLSALHRSDAAGVERILVVWPDGRVAGTAGRDAVGRALRAPSAGPAPST